MRTVRVTEKSDMIYIRRSWPGTRAVCIAYTVYIIDADLNHIIQVPCRPSQIMPLLSQLPSPSQIALGGTVAATALVGWVALHTLRSYLSPLFSPLRVVPGPDEPHWFKGHFASIAADINTGDIERKWMAEFGHIFKFKAFFNVRKYVIITPVLS